MMIIFKRKSGMSILEVLIAMLIFSLAIALIFIIPRSIVDYAKEVDVKMDLYQVAINEAESLASSYLENSKSINVMLNEATYIGTIEILTLEASRILVESSTTNRMVSSELIDNINYASITFRDEDGDYSISFNIVPKQ